MLNFLKDRSHHYKQSNLLLKVLDQSLIFSIEQDLYPKGESIESLKIGKYSRKVPSPVAQATSEASDSKKLFCLKACKIRNAFTNETDYS